MAGRQTCWCHGGGPAALRTFWRLVALLAPQAAYGSRLAARFSSKHGFSVAPPRGATLPGASHPFGWYLGNQPREDTGAVAECGVLYVVSAHSLFERKCPDACPLWVEDDTNGDTGCDFKCVAAGEEESECGKYNKKTNVEDLADGVCRACIVDGCSVCDETVPTDRCKECESTRELQPDGTCVYKHVWIAYTLCGVLVVVVVALLVWIVDLGCRRTTNQHWLDHGLWVRDQRRLRQETEAKEDDVFPLTTNLHRTLVAGPGMILHFNFQVAMILWCLFAAAVSMAFCFQNDDLWDLGMHPVGSRRTNCVLVARTSALQQEIRWNEVAKTAIIYVGSCILCFAYCVLQLRCFQRVDYKHRTMSDFALMLSGLPELPGTQDVEVELEAKLRKKGVTDLVGVSVAWGYTDQEDEVQQLVQEKSWGVERHLSEGRKPKSMGAWRRRIHDFETSVLGLTNEGVETSGGSEAEKAKELLRGLTTSENAFIVLRSQFARDVCFNNLSGGFKFRGRNLSVEVVDIEPDTIQWASFGNPTPVRRCLLTAVYVFLTILVWFVVFYTPYAYYCLTFNYAHGREPGPGLDFGFSMVVTVGNVMTYTVCDQLADFLNFKFSDSREKCYIVLYILACAVNVLLDQFVASMIAMRRVKGWEMNFSGGENGYVHGIWEESWTAGEESAVQTVLARSLYSYVFPAMSLISFLLEPVVLVIIPRLLGGAIVRSHREVKGRAAEAWLAMDTMDLGRYADIILDCALGIPMLLHSSGWQWRLFVVLAGSHSVVYAWDHYHVLRHIPSCVYASYDVEDCCQVLLGICVSGIAFVLTYNVNRGFCQSNDKDWCLEGWHLLLACGTAASVHLLLHLAVLRGLVPRLGLDPPEVDPAEGDDYDRVLQRQPSSWFATNPVHCLRAKFHYEHKSPVRFFTRGMQELQDEAGDKEKSL